MWDGHLGEIYISLHWINLELGVQPATQRPYQNEPKVRKFVAKEVGCMRKANIFEPATSE